MPGFDSRQRRVFLLRSVQTDHVGHPASYPMSTEVKRPCVKLVNHLHPMPRLRMMDLLLHSLISFHSTALKLVMHRDNFTLPVIILISLRINRCALCPYVHMYVCMYIPAMKPHYYCYCIFFQWLHSPCGFWPLLFQFPNLYTGGRTPWTSDQLVARPLYLNTRQHKHRKTHIHTIKHPCPQGGIRTRNHGIRAIKDCSCPRLLGYRDRHCYCITLADSSICFSN
jgi:hypothetical protein